MKALVLSADVRAAAYPLPEQIVPIGKKPVLEYAVENLRDIGITEIGVVVGDGAHVDVAA